MIYLNDSYIKEFHAPIVAVEEEKIITADSCFYAQIGAQPGDTGVVEVNGQKINVINTIKQRSILLSSSSHWTILQRTFPNRRSAQTQKRSSSDHDQK